jgi:hypothetical protein
MDEKLALEMLEWGKMHSLPIHVMSLLLEYDISKIDLLTLGLEEL